MHLVKQKFKDIKIGARIVLKQEHSLFGLIVRRKWKSSLDVEDVRSDEIGDWVADRYWAPYKDYLGTLIPSPDFEKFSSEIIADRELAAYVWTECEKHYGIGIHGSQDPDPIRQVALLILKGDPQAIDLARDILERGQ